MGYLVTAHVFSADKDLDRLAFIPGSIGYRVFLHEKASLFVVDTYRSSRMPQYPFQTMLPSVDIPLDLPDGLGDLEIIYRFLQRKQIANGMKKSYINFCRALSEQLGCSVLSLASDDDLVDFACSAQAGRLANMRCLCGDLQITFEAPTAVVQPLLPEDEDEADFLTDVEPLQRASSSIQVLPRDLDWPLQLHNNALQAFKAYNSYNGEFLGLGSFDPPKDESFWKLLVTKE